MKTYFFRFSFIISSLFFVESASAQLLFQEGASNLGCDDSSYGIGFLGGGISFYDFDNDGWDDITISSHEGRAVKFFKNISGSFVQVDFGLNDPLFETKTVQWVDYDNDGDNDLFVTSNIDSNRLYRNNGAMQFTDITVSAGLMTNDHRSFGASWGDYDKDGLLDIFVSSRHYDDLTIPNILYRNNGDDTFTNVNSQAQIPATNYFSFCSAFIDYNDDGWLDIYVANDRDPSNLMYKNNGNGTFSEVGEETGTDVVINAMSTTIGDYNRDGHMDIYVTNTQQGNVFLRNNGDNTFTDIAEESGTIFESVSWGSVFIDADNDSDLDLYVSGVLDGSTPYLSAAFYENNGIGDFTIPTDAGFDVDTAESYGNAMGDINNDGYPDMVVLNYSPDNIFIWENQSDQSNNWVKVKLEGTISNRQGIGAQIEISSEGEKQYSFTNLGEGYNSQNSSYEFFGIGTATSIDYIKVEWPSGLTEIVENPSINAPITIVEGENILEVTPVNTNTELTVYPLPAKETICMSVDGPDVINAYRILDISGNLILKEDSPESICDIYIGNISSGLYLLEITLNSDQKIFKKILLE